MTTSERCTLTCWGTNLKQTILIVRAFAIDAITLFREKLGAVQSARARPGREELYAHSMRGAWTTHTHTPSARPVRPRFQILGVGGVPVLKLLQPIPRHTNQGNPSAAPAPTCSKVTPNPAKPLPRHTKQGNASAAPDPTCTRRRSKIIISEINSTLLPYMERVAT